jgi:predicted extracellular nuclease
MKKLQNLIILLLIGTSAYAQTNPSAQSLPYSEDFSGLLHTSTSYPAGWQGWQVTTTLGSTFNTAAPTLDKALTATSSASTTSGNIHNYNGKIGALNSGSSGDLALVLAINTSGKSNILVNYDIMTIRNPYDGTGNTRINEVTLQYRVGNTGTFTTLSGIEYQNNTTLMTTSGSTTPQNTETKSITLPSACNNQSEIQLRWISRQVSGAGSRPSFAVDNITISDKVIKNLSAEATSQASEAVIPVAGVFTLTFTPATTSVTTFDYTISGTAALNTDYTISVNGGASPSDLSSATGTISVPSGASGILVTITPVNDHTPEGSESVILTLSNPSDDYVAGSSKTLFIIDDDPTKIHDIQGSGSSALAGGNVVEAIVTGVYPSLNPAGFFVQEENEDKDADPNTAEGLFIVSTATVKIGDKVRVSGIVQENSTSPSFGQAVMHTSTVTVLASNQKLPAFTDISFPLNAASDYEHFEGMRINFPDKLTVSDNYNLGRFGEIHLSEGGPVYQPTQLVDPNDTSETGNTSSGVSNVAAVNALMLANSLRTVLLDDGNDNIQILPYVNADKTLRIGSTTKNMKGIMGFGFSSYRIQPIPSNIPVFTYAARPKLPSVGKSNIKVSSFNVLNYFNGNGTGGGYPTARGAHSAAEFARQRDKIIGAIVAINADIVGLTEIENDGTDSNSAIADLVKGLNSLAGAGTYDFIRDGANIQNFGTDAIKCAIIYKPATVRPNGQVKLSSDAIFNRPPVAQTFTAIATCSQFTYVINHFKSKSATGASGADIDQADGQGAYNDRRKQQSTALVKFLRDSVINVIGSDRIISMGDYNAYFQEDPLDRLRDSGYEVLSHAYDYSYQFDGQLGSLDHAVVSSSISPYITGVAKWNLNAAEPTHLGYDDSINDASGDFVNKWGSTYSNIPQRSSDHDPVIVGFDFPMESPFAEISVAPSNTVFTGGVPTNIYLGYGPQSDTLKARAKGGKGFIYTWSPSSNLSCTNCLNTVFTPVTPGTYSYTLTATNEQGCSTTKSVSFCVKEVLVPGDSNKVYVCHNGTTREITFDEIPAHLHYHKNDFLGTCDNACGRSNNKRSDDKEEVVLSIKENTVNNIKVYPNPAGEKLYISLPDDMEQATITITDMTGKTVTERISVKGLVELPLEQISEGMYLIQVQSASTNYRTYMMHH